MTAEQIDESVAAQYAADYVDHMRTALPKGISEATRAAEAWQEFSAAVRSLPTTRPTTTLYFPDETGDTVSADLLPDVLHDSFLETRRSLAVLTALADAAEAAAWRVVADLKEDLHELEERAR